MKEALAQLEHQQQEHEDLATAAKQLTQVSDQLLQSYQTVKLAIGASRDRSRYVALLDHVRDTVGHLFAQISDGGGDVANA
jgi:hypothetical protein